MGQLDRPGCGGGTDLDIELPWVSIGYNLSALPSVAVFTPVPWDHSGSPTFSIWDPLLSTGNMPTPPTNPGNVFPHFFWDVATDQLTLKLAGLYLYELVLTWLNAGSGFNRGCAVGYNNSPDFSYDWQGRAANDTWLPTAAPSTLISSSNWVQTTVERGYFPVGGNFAAAGTKLKAYYFHDKGMTIAALNVLATFTVACVSRRGAVAYSG